MDKKIVKEYLGTTLKEMEDVEIIYKDNYFTIIVGNTALNIRYEEVEDFPISEENREIISFPTYCYEIEKSDDITYVTRVPYIQKAMSAMSEEERKKMYSLPLREKK